MADPVRDIVSYSLAQYCDRAHQLHEEDQNTEQFVRFVLCGIDNDRQACIDVIRNRIEDAEIPTLSIDRDYDSVLGIDDDICVRDHPITISLLPRFDDTLKTNVHLQHTFTNIWGEFEVPLHHIPNLGLGRWGDVHNMLRILFPGLYGPERKSFYLTKEEQKDFYDKGLQPALNELLDNRGGDLPPDWEAEMFRARQQSGQLSFSTRILPSWHVKDFCNTLRRHLASNGIAWARDFVILHQIRGVKNATSHSFDQDDARLALELFLSKNGLDYESIVDYGDWYVDVGAEIASTQQRCLTWRTDHHAALVELILEIPTHHATRITSLSSSKYYRDPAAHLIGASGFRITPGVRAQGWFEAQYMQAYLTDKAITYNPERGNFGKFITPAQLLNGKGESYITNLFHLYRGAAEKNFSAARVEVRVPIRHAFNVLVDTDLPKLAECLLSFPRGVYWGFKGWRAQACKYVDDWQRGGAADLRLHTAALLLTAAISWLLNGLHSTPDLGPSSRELLTAVLPRARRTDVEPDQLPYPISLRVDAMEGVEEDEEYQEGIVTSIPEDPEDEEELESEARGDTLVPYVPYGVYQLRELRIGAPVPRFKNRRFEFTDRTFRFMFGEDRAELRLRFARSQTSIPRDPDRFHNRTRQRLIELPEEGESLNFSLEAQGHEFEPPIRDDGSDMEVEDSDEEEGDPLGSGIDNELERTWRQFLIDCIQLTPNRKPANMGPYCIIPRSERDSTTIATYQNINLCDIFDEVQWRVSAKGEWSKVFYFLFPPKGVVKLGKIQNYPKCAYYAQWEGMTKRMSEETAKAARGAMRKMFNTMEWAPYAGCDRIWFTRSLPSQFTHSGTNGGGAAPQVIMRNKKPTWNPARPRDA